MDANVYIDGFNLYYGVAKGTPYKWLNLGKLCQFMVPNYKINKIKYYTAIVSADVRDPDKPRRQRTFLRALQTIPNLSIIKGHFMSHIVYAPLATPPPPGNPANVQVIKTEEKGSDVNLATHLLWDAVNNEYDAAVIISNDSDLLEPIKIVKQQLGKRIIIINPHKNRPSVQLQGIADEFKTISIGTLQSCQFPVTVTDARGSFSKPSGW